MISPSNRALRLWAAAAMFVGSGFSALAFQTVLNKYFSFIFGVSSYAAATVLAAFMAGLAVGSYLRGKLASARIRRHFLWYGVLELVIGLYALGFIAIASWVDHGYTPIAREYHFSLRVLTFVRGGLVARDAQIVAERPHGRYVTPELGGFRPARQELR